MKVKFRSVSEAEIKNVKDDLEGPEDDKHVVLTMPMSMFVKMKDIAALSGFYEGQDLYKMFWVDQEGVMVPRLDTLSHIQLHGVHNNGWVKIGPLKFENCRAQKARWTPFDDGLAKLSVEISVIKPPKNQLNDLLALKGSHFKVEFSGDQAVFEEEEEEQLQLTEELSEEEEEALKQQPIEL